MKMLNLCIALIFSITLCCIVAPVDSYAKSSDTTTQVEKMAKKSSTKAEVKNVNINSADKEMLAQIPGVGPVTADAILKYRKANGNFKSTNDLLSVKGIGEKTLEKMKPFVRL